MAFETSFVRQSKDVALTLRWAGRTRTLRLSQGLAAGLLGILPLLAIWYLCATAYLIFHDKLLSALMTHQTDMQYAYEDRISDLKTQLDRETSRGVVDRHTLDTMVRDLDDRSSRLEARAATLDSMIMGGLGRSPGHGVARGGDQASSSSGSDGAQDAVPVVPDTPPTLRLDGSVGPGGLPMPGGDHHVQSEPSFEQHFADLDASLSRVERGQAQLVASLRDPALRAVDRMQTALAQTGLPSTRWQTRANTDVGGPFVPLQPGADGGDFGQSVQLVKDAIAQVGRLSEIIDEVPLRKPLEGPIEVTSTFGARLDPFYGRPAMHTGIDLHETNGDGVEATAVGIVTIAGPEGGYGNMVEIDHGNGLTTRYAHMSSIAVVVHQRVTPGTIVGRVGSTGRATGPHLHYETRINGEPVDPARFLKAGGSLFPG